MRLGPNYDTIAVDISATPQARDPASCKLTFLHANANRNLRHVTGLAAQQALLAGESSTEAPGAGPSAAPAAKQSGGHVRVQIDVTGIAGCDFVPGAARWPTMSIAVTGRDLHAPLVERLVELPMDIDEGRANGQLVIRSHDAATWHYPEFHGRVAVRGSRFHFWDATDEIEGDLDLLFEGDRLYLHNARGAFGAVPMTLTGDLDLDPATGSYRLSATVPGVEVNALRATLGVRPTPFPVAGAVAGTLHITGPLEKPVFSGARRAAR
jgi:hypothetical protein